MANSVRAMTCGFLCLTVENPAHCDFVKLRNMLVRTHMQDLKDVTRETHYENYRAHCIQSMTRMVVKERNRKYELTILWQIPVGLTLVQPVMRVWGGTVCLDRQLCVWRNLFVILLGATRTKRHFSAWYLFVFLSSKLTRESGTDFPIPMVPGVPDNETEKLIREKDEEVHRSRCPDEHEQTLHHESHLDPKPWVDPHTEPEPDADPQPKGSWQRLFLTGFHVVYTFNHSSISSTRCCIYTRTEVVQKSVCLVLIVCQAFTSVPLSTLLLHFTMNESYDKNDQIKKGSLFSMHKVLIIVFRAITIICIVPNNAKLHY